MKLLDLLFGKREMDVTGNTVNQEPVQSTPVQAAPVMASGEFGFAIEDVFTIMGRGTVVTGTVLTGSINVNDEVTIVRTGLKTVVTGIEMFRKSLDHAQEGDKCGILLRGVNRDDVERGDLLVK